jgi:hypothetical protein
MVLYASNSNYVRGTDRKIVGGGQPRQKSMKLYLEKKLKAKELEAWLKCRVVA